MTSVASRFMDVDPHMKNAYSSTVRFDISHLSGKSNALREGRRGQIGEAMEVAIRKNAPKDWELDVRGLISSRKWLQNYGLRKNRLQLNQILPAIGFKLSDEFDETLKKPVCSRYGGGLFRHLMRTDGKTFNVACSKDKLSQLEKRLVQAIYLFRRRLEWLTTESRRVFGVIEERSVTIVLDIRNMSPQQFDQYRTSLERVLREQVSQLAKFNLIRACEDVQQYSKECVPVSHDTLETSVQWVWNLDRLAPVSNTSCAEAILMALQDKHNEAVYLFTEGTSVDSGCEVLNEKVSTARLKAPVHVVSFNCDSSETIKFLKQFSTTTSGKFHAYAVVMELDAYEAQASDGVTNKANILLRRKTFGGIPPGAGVREDVVLVFEEMEEARNNLAQVRMLIENAPEPSRGDNGGQEGEPGSSLSTKSEQYMSSVEWLIIYGLDARKLGLFDVLSGVAFKHQDGVVNVMQKPPEDSATDAVVQQKLVNARYCESFPIVRWKDGQVVHVQVTPEVHRGYEEKVKVAMNKIQQRIDWLNKGSRALFGTLVEDQIYILIDTSASMQPSLTFVKQRLFVLMQEQLRHKRKFNIVTFNSKAVGWKDRLVEVTESSLQSAWTWVQNLSCWGSTNTYGAIQLAMSDPQTQAIYLLTDGRPDQPPRSVLAQVQMRKKIPIHTISFNCNDTEANQFLFDLAEITGGRYHYYSEGGKPVDQPESWESMDIKLLKDEIKRGFENLEELAGLRDECTSMAWKKETESLRKSIESTRESHEGIRKSAMPPLDSKDLYRPATPPRPPSSTPPPRPASAGPTSTRSPIVSRSRRPPSPDGGGGHSPLRTSDGLRTKLTRRPKSAKVSLGRKPMVAGHTRTSLLRTLSSSGRFSPNEWLLPETKQLFQLQAERQRELAQRKEKSEQLKTKKTKRMIKSNEMSPKQWLAKHGLVAKRLTILDALGSTFVSHKPKYVSILDKYVMSKVFNDILPIAHLSKNQHVRLVNPNGVNLKEYEEKVKKAVTKYRNYLNKIVWEALPEVARDEFESEVPVDFEANKCRMIKLLEEAEWPIKEKDVLLMAKEIMRGEKFIQQSQALRKAVKSKDENLSDNDDDDDDDDGSSVELVPVSARSQKSHKSQKSEERSRSRHSDVSPPRSRNSDTSPPRSRMSDNSPSRPEPEEPETAVSSEPKVKEGLGQVLRSVDKSSQGLVKESKEVIKARIKVKLDTMRGQKVIARKNEDGLYYPGVVLKCADHRHAKVKYDDGSVVEIQTRHLLPVSGAVARPHLAAGDYALMRVVNLDSSDECYVPVVVQLGPGHCDARIKFFSVRMYNGQEATTMRKYLVKISKERFELTSMYILCHVECNEKEADEKVYLTPRKESVEEEASLTPRKESVEEKVSLPPGTESAAEEVNSTPRRSPSPRPDDPDPNDENNDKSDKDKRDDMEEELERLKRWKQKLKEQQQRQSARRKKLRRKERKLKEKEEEMNKRLEEIVPEATPRLLHLRKTLPPLRPLEEVLAQWSDDGWYYRGIVKHKNDDYSYDIEDSTGLVERIWRENIFSEDNTDQIVEDGKHVIALHPDYIFSYVPGIVQNVTDSEVVVKFYDDKTSTTEHSEVYVLDSAKYDVDVDFIEARENSLLGCAVVAKEDRSGAYYPGTVRKKLNHSEYEIMWADGKIAVQKAIHIFSANTRRPQLAQGDKVLTLFDPVHVKFLPGTLIGVENDKLVVVFCNGERRNDVDQVLCYWLSTNYYMAAVQYFEKRDQSIIKPEA